QQSAQASKTHNDASDNVDSNANTGLKSLQQRLSSVRKSSGTPTPAAELHTPMGDSGSTSLAAPSVASVPPLLNGSDSNEKTSVAAGMREGPSTPNLPSIRTAQLPGSAGRDSVSSTRDSTPAFSNTLEHSSISSSTIIDATPIKMPEPTVSSSANSNSTIGSPV